MIMIYKTQMQTKGEQCELVAQIDFMSCSLQKAFCYCVLAVQGE